ncbi:SGNH/GDSL hydrolase family protein [Hydrogenophaga sp.]|uniref:SGNH/GDSL hydrolase family protein n=1 Tax=Hydrogenophaga sp. TaxID=1904254 RepID=UPI0025BB8F12|nr:SGNH/GDSL hydrolase family protein [Hydrogenophaga sp.]
MLIRHQLAALAAALLLAACGGGDPAPVKTTAVKVAGDSLNDSGTFGFKFTVQTTPTAMIWTDRVAAAVNAPALCPRYAATSATTVALNPTATSCTSYGVGGGRINPTGLPGDTTPFSVVQQLKDIAASGNYGPEELLLVDGGGNDAADLVGAYLNAQTDGGISFGALVGELGVTVPSADLVPVGVTYMTALANRLADAIDTEALAKGAQRVVVITAPDVTVTPRFLALLAGISATTDPATAAAVKSAANSWVVAFNTQLKSRFISSSKVAVVDFYAELNKWVSNPTDPAYGLTNVTTPACPQVGTDVQGLPTYNIGACTDILLNTAPFPAGETAINWWQTYVFSDNFHGTPRTNQLMGELVTTALEARGWK